MKIDSNKKTLLIFFGELRTFEHAIPHLKKLDEVDVMVSTWMESNYGDLHFNVNETKIRSIYSDVKYFNIIDSNKIEDFNLKSNSWKLFHHWKTSINNLENLEEYDTVMFHRCDLISNWHSILELDIDDGVLYLHKDFYPEIYKPSDSDSYWINDYYFFGKPNMIKQFVNLINSEDMATSHFDMWETISKNNIKINNFILKAFLIRNENVQFIQNKLINIEELPYLTGPGSSVNIIN